MFKKTALASMLAVLFAGNVYAQDDATEASAPWTTTLSGTLVSDYVFRGVSQTQTDPALQGGLTFAHESGFYTGIWGSSVDFIPDNAPPAAEDGADVEVDAFIGYGFSFSEHWTGDISLTRYMYPGTVDGVDYDYNELIGKVIYDEWLTSTVGYTDDYSGGGVDALYVGISASHELPWWGLSLTGEVGHYDLDDLVSYMHYGIGLAKDFNDHVSATLAWASTDNDGEDFFGDSGDPGLFFTVALSTDL